MTGLPMAPEVAVDGELRVEVLTVPSGGAVVGNWSAAACVPIVGNHMVSERDEGLVFQSRRSFLWHDCACMQYGMQYFSHSAAVVTRTRRCGGWACKSGLTGRSCQWRGPGRRD